MAIDFSGATRTDGIIANALLCNSATSSTILDFSKCPQGLAAITIAGTSGTRVGVFQLQMAVDGTNWDNVTLTTALSNAAVNTAYRDTIELSLFPAKYARVSFFPSTPGTGTWTSYAYLKG